VMLVFGRLDARRSKASAARPSEFDEPLAILAAASP